VKVHEVLVDGGSLACTVCVLFVLAKAAAEVQGNAGFRTVPAASLTTAL